MKELYFKALEAYVEVLSLHIDTKTSDALFHSESEKFYETLFDVAHKIWEKEVDLWLHIEELSLQEKKDRAYDIIENLLNDIEDYKDNNEVSLWTEDLLWSLANSIEEIKWTAKWFTSK